jgi:hypothetical protein
MANIVTLIGGAIKPGGHFIFTIFDRVRVEALLDREAQAGRKAWIVQEDGRKKYHIERANDAELTPKIRLLLPFTRGALIEEYLVSAEAIIDHFTRPAGGFTLAARYNFDEKFTDMVNYGKAQQGLSDGDRTFIGLYMTVVLKRN